MMELLKLTKNDRRSIYTQVGIKRRLLANVVEKDWWVTTVLRALFSSDIANYISFKGGTSLSKCWNLIERFSEDVDIALDREYLGFSGELSNNQINDRLRRASCSFVRKDLKEKLHQNLLELGINESDFSITVNLTPVSTTDPETLIVNYNSVFEDNLYIKHAVLIEVSGRSMSEPVENVNIRSFVAEIHPNTDFSDKSFSIRAVSPKRTFLEKVFLLHEEFYKSPEHIRSNRMSRHLYDLEKLMNTSFAKEAMTDKSLYWSIVNHREKFIGLRGFDYSSLSPQSLNLIPPDSGIKLWKDDYKAMQSSMIYGDSLPFHRLIDRIQDLNSLFHHLDWA